MKQIHVYSGSVFAGLICYTQISEKNRKNEMIPKVLAKY